MQLVVDKINKSFGKNHVLRDLSFTAETGAAFGLLGRNGSGKTTTIRIIMDLFGADSGTVKIDGQPNSGFTSRIGYLPEERGLYPKRIIQDQMVYIGELRGMKTADAKRRAALLLEKFGIGEYLHRKLDTLSKGNQQKIQLAIAMISDPDIIILDEPFSGLDPVNAKLLKDAVSESVKSGKLVIFSSHQMGYVEEFCDHIGILNDGKIVLSGSLRQIKKSYPRNRVMVRPETDNVQDFARSLRENGAIAAMSNEISVAGHDCILRLKDTVGKKDLFQLVSQYPIDLFSVLEPTLEEIFVEKVGALDVTV